ncbi:MAG: hypothetical protein H7Z43_04600 [Clostridia bacterium]|nr:hypothetical protein [Deltaproteobacteria bacterium]
MTKLRTPDFSELTTEELRAELARRKAAELPDNPTMSQIEDMLIELGGDRPKAFGSMLERLGPETGKPMGCPMCGQALCGQRALAPSHNPKSCRRADVHAQLSLLRAMQSGVLST